MGKRVLILPSHFLDLKTKSRFVESNIVDGGKKRMKNQAILEEVRGKGKKSEF